MNMCPKLPSFQRPCHKTPNTVTIYIFTFSLTFRCFSSIGRVGGRQVVSLHDNCKYRGKVVHEILHALGFFHEHSRSDRDKYIKVIWKNIKKGKKNHHNGITLSKLVPRTFCLHGMEVCENGAW